MSQADIINRLEQAGWTVEERLAQPFRLPASIARRYPNLPVAFTEFVSGLSSCTNERQTAWFLCEADFAGTSGAAFCWDEWERMSLDAADGDKRIIAEVRGFWDGHFPFLMSVEDGYAYFAIRTANDGFGRVVSGREPEFEEVSQVAQSFEEFLALLIAGEIRA